MSESRDPDERPPPDIEVTDLGSFSRTSDGGPEALFDTVPGGPPAAMSMAPPAALPAGTDVGPFRVLGVLGAGGMGFVYRARQSTPDRDIALKVIRGDAFSPALRRRFEYEVEVLGRLDHPGIGRIYAAGTHEGADGPQPYFAMELVDGVDLFTHCVRGKLAARERVTLVAEVCDAIEHAHSKGVIHRDLKPSNILVTKDGRPKVLDFGIARASEPDLATTQQTMAGQLIGTLPYMSPEQLDGDPGAIDIRSDVYALGVVLHETLTGHLPHDTGERSFIDAARFIRDSEPTRLRRHDTALRGDLETIVLTALEKDPARRYRSAAAFADDLRRYLESRPIAARPATVPDRIIKFTRRNPILVAGVAATAITLVAGTIVSTVFGLDANAERRTTQDALDFQSRMLTGIEPHRMGQGILDRLRAHVERTDAGDLAAFDAAVAGVNHADLARGVLEENVLARAAATLERDYADRPRLEASLRESLGEFAAQLGLHGRARTEFERAATLAEARGRAGGPAFARALNYAALVAAWDGDRPGARTLVDRVKAVRGDGVRPGDPESIETVVIDTYLRLSEARAVEPGEAAATVAEFEALYERLAASPAASPRSLAVVAVELGRAYHSASRLDDSLAIMTEGIERCDAVFGPDHVYTMLARSGIVHQLVEHGRHEEAEPIAAALLEHQRRALGDEHLFTGITIDLLARSRSNLGRYAEAEALYRETIETSARVFGERHDGTLVSRTNLAKCFADQERWAEASELYAETLVIARRFPPKLMAVAMNAQGLGRGRLELGDYEGAELELRRSLTTFRIIAMGQSTYAGRSIDFLVDLLERTGRPEEAEEWRAQRPEDAE